MIKAEDEHRERLLAMVEDNGQTWDLSPKDKAAIKHVLAERDALALALDDAAHSINSLIERWKGVLAPGAARQLIDIRDRADRAARAALAAQGETK